MQRSRFPLVAPFSEALDLGMRNWTDQVTNAINALGGQNIASAPPIIPTLTITPRPGALWARWNEVPGAVVYNLYVSTAPSLPSGGPAAVVAANFANPANAYVFSRADTSTVFIAIQPVGAGNTPGGVSPWIKATPLPGGSAISNLDGVPDGSSYGRTLGGQLSSGILPTAFGKNLVPNPGFENNLVGVPVLTNIALGNPICDSWIFSQNDASLFFVQLSNASAHSGSNRIEVGWTTNTTIAASGLAAGYALSTGKLPLQINDIVRVSGWYEMAVNSVPAGVLTFARIIVQCYSQAGAVLGAVVAAQTQTATASWTQIQAAVTIPSTIGGGVPAWGQVVCQLFLQNTNGTSQTLPGNGFANAFFDDIRVVIQNTAFDLTPISTTYLNNSSANVLSQSGVTSTINVAAFTLQTGDGQISYNSGSVNPGSLGTWFVFVDDPTYSGGAVTYQAAAAAVSTVAANGRILVGKITTVSGGGGSGGTGGNTGNIGICFSGNTRLDDGRKISEIKPGDTVLTARGLRPVRAVIVNPHDGPMLDMGGGELVTPGHLFRVDGQWVPARELYRESVHYSGEVWNLEIDTEHEDERNYVLRNDRVAHNFQPGGTC